MQEIGIVKSAYLVSLVLNICGRKVQMLNLVISLKTFQ